MNSYASLEPYGSLVPLPDAPRTENCIVAGKIIESWPLKLNVPNKPILVLWIKDCCRRAGYPQKKCRIVLARDIARQVARLKFEKDDYVAFFRPTLTANSSVARQEEMNYHEYQICVGLLVQYNPDNFLFKRKYRDGKWHLLSDHMKACPITHLIPSNESSELRGNENEIEKDCNNSKLIVSKYFTDNGKSNKCEKSASQIESIDERISDTTAVGEPQCAKIRNEFTLKSSQNAHVRDLIRKNNKRYQYTKLADVKQECKKLYVYGVITNVQKEPVSSNGKRYVEIHITDESISGDFPLNLYIDEFLPEMRVNETVGHVGRFHRMSVARRGKDSLFGIVHNTHDIIFFDPITEKLHTVAKSCTFTKEDEKRVAELFEWFPKRNKINCVPADLQTIVGDEFIALKSLKPGQENFHLKCVIKAIKSYDTSDIIILKVSDGTQPELPCFAVDFELENWSEVQGNPTYVKNQNEVDITVENPDDIFEKLAPGDRITLKNIKVTESCGSKESQDLTVMLVLEGKSENLVIDRKTEKIQNCSDSQVSIGSKHFKRKLFSEKRTISSTPSPLDSANKQNDKPVEVISPTIVLKRIDGQQSGPDKETDNSEDSRIKNPDGMILPKIVLTRIDGRQLKQSKEMDKREDNQVIPTREQDSEISSSEELLANILDNMENGCNISKYANEDRDRKMSRSKDIRRNHGEPSFKRICSYIRENEHENDNLLTEWPDASSIQGFKIQVYLTAIDPPINESSTDDEVKSLMKCLCNACQNYFPYEQIDWMYQQDEDGEGSVFPVCCKCAIIGRIDFFLAVIFQLEDEKGIVCKVLISKEHAAKFFNCTVLEFCGNINVRNEAKRKLNAITSISGPLITEIIATPSHTICDYLATNIFASESN